MSEAIERVETFIRRIHDLEYVFTPEAREMYFTNIKGEKDRSLADWLSRRIFSYEQNREDKAQQLFYAKLCLLWINRAFACGVVQEGEGLARKLKECREKNVQLERHNKVLSEEYLNLKLKYEDFTSRMNVLDENDLEDER